MATIPITIPDAVAPAVVAAFERAYPAAWAAAQAATPPLTGAQFVQQQVASYVKQVYVADVTQQRQAAAMADPSVTSAQAAAIQ